MPDPQTESQPLLSHCNDITEETKVYPLIHEIRQDVNDLLYVPHSYDNLLTPELTDKIVQPLLNKYELLQQEGNKAVVFCLLLNRVYYLRDDDLTTATLSKSRAILCEILATRAFRFYAQELMDLTFVLTTVWSVYAGADPKMLEQERIERDDELEDRVGNAIELAIMGKAKRFIKSSSCQKVIQSIWSGKCVYQAESSHSILSDTYKRTPIHFYDARAAPLLDHYRLKVPAIRSVVEYANFVILFILYIIATEFSVVSHFNLAEICFAVFALGFTLEKLAAMQEHGIKVYFKGTWNAFDLAFVTNFFVYIVLRLYGVYYHKQWAKVLGNDFLALIACLLFPRLAFVTFKNNLMVLCLRAMLVQFTFLMAIAVFCFCGFLYALWTLARNEAGYSAGQISWWMLDLWFGLDASGFDNATKFHPVMGPLLMVVYACLSNTLLLTVLVSILSNTFAKINEDAESEALFRKAVSTMEGVKADFLFSYQPPVNLVALSVLLPSSYLLSPRWFHKINVFLIRLTNFPLLLMVGWWERQSLAAKSDNFKETVEYLAERVYETLPKYIKRIGLFEGFAGSGSDIDAIFEIEDEDDSALDMGDLDDDNRLNQFARKTSGPATGNGAAPPHASPPRLHIPWRTRHDSLMPSTGLAQPYYQALPNPRGVVEQLAIAAAGAHSPTLAHRPLRRRITSSARGKQPRDASRTAGSQAKNAIPVGRTHSSPLAIDNRALPQIGDGHDVTSEGTWTGLSPTPSTNPDFSRLEMRMDEMEKRQENIEDLLKQIASTLQALSQKSS